MSQADAAIAVIHRTREIEELRINCIFAVCVGSVLHYFKETELIKRVKVFFVAVCRRELVISLTQ